MPRKQAVFNLPYTGVTVSHFVMKWTFCGEPLFLTIEKLTAPK
jgi:hypothetical protein